MTIGGVEEIARQVGIAPEHVRSAVKAVAARHAGAPSQVETPVYNRFLGGPQRLLFERVVDGELSEADFSIVVDEIRRGLGTPGQVNQLGKSFSWVMVRGPSRREVEIAVTARAGVTRLTVSENMSSLSDQVFAPVIVVVGLIGSITVGGIVGGGLHAPWLLPVAIPAWWSAAYMAARKLYQRATRGRETEIRGLIERLSLVVADLTRDNPGLPGPAK
jgi:hypothetical protein